jgi:hypothetical protein
MRDVATSVNKEMRKDAELARLKKELADAQGSSECFGFMLIVVSLVVRLHYMLAYSILSATISPWQGHST